MRRIFLKVAYDGTDFHGWQLQPGVRTVEGELNRALSELTKEEITVIGASRTDAGVHALGNVAVFDSESTIPPNRFSYAVNTLLPDDVKVVFSKEVSADWHPRKNACRKTYEYRIYTGEFDDPLKRRNSWHVSYRLDADKMQKAAQYLVGEHDFVSFCSVHTQAESTVRTIYSIDVIEEKREGPDEDSGEKIAGGGNDGTATGSDFIIRICGNGFLYNMVRIIAGSLAETGSGKQSPEWMEEVLKSRDRTKGGPTAPPQGLLLKQIVYDA